MDGKRRAWKKIIRRTKHEIVSMGRSRKKERVRMVGRRKKERKKLLCIERGNRNV